MSDDPIDCFVFDLFGTLVNFSSLASRFAGTVADPHAFVAAWRQKQLMYALTATVMDRYVDFDAVTAAAFRYTAASYGAAHDAVAVADAVECWSGLPAYPDAAEALRTVRERGFKTAVLSNGTPSAIAATARACGFAEVLDAVLSVDAVHRFKPHPSVYQLAVDHFATPASRIAFVSSNGWDATGAAEFGFRVIWCNRNNLPAETFGAAPARTISSLAELLDA